MPVTSSVPKPTRAVMGPAGCVFVLGEPLALEERPSIYALDPSGAPLTSWMTIGQEAMALAFSLTTDTVASVEIGKDGQLAVVAYAWWRPTRSGDAVRAAGKKLECLRPTTADEVALATSGGDIVISVGSHFSLLHVSRPFINHPPRLELVWTEALPLTTCGGWHTEIRSPLWLELCPSGTVLVADSRVAAVWKVETSGRALSPVFEHRRSSAYFGGDSDEDESLSSVEAVILAMTRPQVITVETREATQLVGSAIDGEKPCL